MHHLQLCVQQHNQKVLERMGGKLHTGTTLGANLQAGKGATRTSSLNRLQSWLNPSDQKLIQPQDG
jgi:hypothetical protein